MTLPNFIGIGAPKAGTTWLAKCLGEHPDVFMPAAKELVFFDYGDFDQRLSDYQAHFAGAQAESAVGEFTTRYLASRRPAARIRAMIPDVRLIVCLRNPVDQIYSHYWHLARQNFHQPVVQKEICFEEALERFGDMLKRPARYAEHLRHWFEHFEREQFLILLFDDIQAKPAEVLRQTFEFLKVDSQFQPRSVAERGTEVRSGTSPRSELAQKVHATLYTTLARQVYQPIKRAVGVQRADALKRTLRIRPIMESLFFRKGYPPMKAATRKALQAEFADQVGDLETLLDRSLKGWR